MNSMPFSGVYTAIVTPMRPDGAVDWDSLASLIDHQAAGGVTGIVAVGTTGESPTLNAEEHLEVVRRSVELAAGRVQVIAGTGSNSTREAVEYTRIADNLGVDGILQVSPYYNKPTQEGLFRHFSAVAEVTTRPIMLYSIPGRCVIEIGVETCRRLRAAHPHICAIKEAGGSCDRVSQLRTSLGPDYGIFSGDDSLTLPFLGAGAEGVVSVASNLHPRAVVDLVGAARANDLGRATALHLQFYSLFRDLFLEPNPVPVKYALRRAGIISSDTVRLPLCPLSDAVRPRLDATLDSLPTPR